CRVDSLRGVSRFARAHPHLLPLLGLRRAPGHYALTTLLHRLDPQALREALARAFPEVSLPPGEREVWVVDGKVLRGSRKGGFPQVRLVEVLAMGLRLTLAQARAEGREAQALMGVLERLGAEGLGGGVVGGDAGYLYPEVARGIREKGGLTSWR
ncbi:hypothetical protein, partial [Deinococcus sp.]|uniref:hypothetical protein n=1 Tax=Deinococcus sp. TaxID=47478 RepID=UPI00391D4A3D